RQSGRLHRLRPPEGFPDLKDEEHLRPGAGCPGLEIRPRTAGWQEGPVAELDQPLQVDQQGDGEDGRAERQGPRLRNRGQAALRARRAVEEVNLAAASPIAAPAITSAG